MKKFLAAIVIGATFLVPTQIMFSPAQMVLAAEYGDEPDTYEFMGRLRVLEMKMQKLEHMAMEKKMTKAKMEKMEKMLSRVEREIDQLIAIGDE
jgi:hypothetical protein